MLLSILKSKIHRATVTESNVDYEGSITIDQELMDRVGILTGEKVHVANLTNGARIETYAIPGKAGSGAICMNGGAALHAKEGHMIIIMVYALMTHEEASSFKPSVVLVDESNHVKAELAH